MPRKPIKIVMSSKEPISYTLFAPEGYSPVSSKTKLYEIY